MWIDNILRWFRRGSGGIPEASADATLANTKAGGQPMPIFGVLSRLVNKQRVDTLDSASDQAEAIIRHFEGCRLAAYQDQRGVWTIGWGETEGIKPGMVWTQQQADQALAARIDELSSRIMANMPGKPIRRCELDAFVSFAYNVGLERWRTSTLLKLYLAGKDCTAHFGEWTHVNGQTDVGLFVRRCAERLLFKGLDWRYGL